MSNGFDLFILEEEDGTATPVDAAVFGDTVQKRLAELHTVHSTTGAELVKDVGARLNRVHRESSTAYERCWARTVPQVTCRRTMVEATTLDLPHLATNLATFCIAYVIHRPVADDEGQPSPTVVDPDEELYERAVETVYAIASDGNVTEHMQFASAATPDRFDEYAAAVAALTACYLSERCQCGDIEPTTERYRQACRTYRGLKGLHGIQNGR